MALLNPIAVSMKNSRKSQIFYSNLKSKPKNLDKFIKQTKAV